MQVVNKHERKDLLPYKAERQNIWRNTGTAII